MIKKIMYKLMLVIIKMQYHYMKTAIQAIELLENLTKYFLKEKIILFKINKVVKKWEVLEIIFDLKVKIKDKIGLL